VLRPQSSGQPVASKGFGGKEAVPLAQGGPVRLPPWAEASVNRLSVPPSTVHPVVTRLPNGLQLIVQPESISHTVRVYGHVRNNPDLETPPGQEGVDEVLDRLLSFGTTSLDRLAYQGELDRIAADASAGTDFSLEVLADQFERGVELLADNQLRPALPGAAFAIVQRQVASSVAGRLESPTTWRAARSGWRSSRRATRCSARPRRRPSGPSRRPPCARTSSAWSAPT